MSSHFSAKSAFFVTALAVGLSGAGGASPAQAAITPATKCGQAVVKAVATCTKKAVNFHAACYKTTGAPCLSTDTKLTAAGDSVTNAIRAKCEDDAAVSGAGYPSYTPSALGAHFADICKLEGKAIIDRTYRLDGTRFTGADKDGQKCLSSAAKASGKYLSLALGVLGKCVGQGCSTVDTDAEIAALAATTSTKLDTKCPTFATLTGTTATAYVAAATAQIPSAVASPCDPLDTTRCVFPFPNDQFTIPSAGTESGRRMALGRAALPKNSAGTPKPVLTAKWNTTDGFSVGPMILMNDANIDLTVTGAAPITDLARSLDANAPVVLLDAETGEKQLLWLERDTRGATPADQPIIGHVGRDLKDSHRYIVVMRNMKNSMGVTLPASAGFAIYRDNTPTDILPIESRRPHMEDIFASLTGWGYTRSELYLAWDFTTQSPESAAGKLLAMRDDAFEKLGSAAPSFTVDTVVEPVDGSTFRQVDGTFQVPNYLKNNGDPGSTLQLDAFGMPISKNQTFTAKYRCIIPYAATTGGGIPAVPARASLYGHGLLGSYDEVSGGNVRAMSSEHNMIFCATYWTGFSEEDAEFVIFKVLPDFSFFPDFIDRQHQGILNFLMLGRLMIHPNGFASNAAFQVGGQSMIDTSELFYDGNSQGGILGGVLAAFSQDATRFSLGVPGMNYSTLLNRSSDFVDFDALLTSSYPASTDRNLLLSVAQIVWDRTDPNGHINHLLANPYENTPAKKVLYQVAFGDHQVAPVTVEVACRTNGAYIHQPTLVPGKVVPEVTPYYGIPAIPAYPFDGSAMVVWDAGNPAPPIGNTYPPEIHVGDPDYAGLASCAQTHDGDPHSCPRNNPATRVQKSEFLKHTGKIVDVCSGAACEVP